MPPLGEERNVIWWDGVVEHLDGDEAEIRIQDRIVRVLVDLVPERARYETACVQIAATVDCSGESFTLAVLPAGVDESEPGAARDAMVEEFRARVDDPDFVPRWRTPVEDDATDQE